MAPNWHPVVPARRDKEHLKLARVVCEGSVHDDEPSRRLEVGVGVPRGLGLFRVSGTLAKSVPGLAMPAALGVPMVAD